MQHAKHGNVKDGFICLLLAAITVVTLAAGFQLVETLRATRAAVEHADEAIQHLDATASAALPDAVIGEMDLWRTSSEHQIDLARRDLIAQIAATRDAAQGELHVTREELLQRTDSLSDRVDAQLAGLRADLKPTLAAGTGALNSYGALAKDGQDSLDDLYPDLKATVESGDVAATSVAHASQAVQDATPEMLSTFERIGRNSDLTTGSTAVVMDNLARATKPLPMWMRVVLGVAPPLAGVAAGAASVYTLTAR